MIPEAERLRGSVQSFLAGIRGTGGFLDLIKERYGVDLGSREGLETAGIDPDAGVALFRAGDAAVLAIGVSDREAFDRLLVRRAQLGGGADVSPVEGTPPLKVATPRMKKGAVGPPPWKLVWGVTDDRVGLMVATEGSGDPVARWRELAGGADASFTTTPRAQRAQEETPEGTVLWGAGKASVTAPEELGMLASLMNPYLSGLDDWTGHLHLSESAVGLRLRGLYTGEGTLPARLFAESSSKRTPFAELWPKSSTLFVRFRLDLEPVRAMPGFIRDRVLPKRLPRIDGLHLPPTEDVVEGLTGEMAVGLMGLDREVTLASMLKPKQKLSTLLQLFHLAIAVRVEDPAAVLSGIESLAVGLDQEAWATAPVNGGGWRGMSFVKFKTRHYAAIIKGDVLVLLTGAGEVARFVDVGKGEAINLASMGSAGGGEASADRALGLVEGAPTLGAFVAFTRITRELSDKGVPPYFLKIINDIRSVSASLDVRAQDALLELSAAL